MPAERARASERAKKRFMSRRCRPIRPCVPVVRMTTTPAPAAATTVAMSGIALQPPDIVDDAHAETCGVASGRGLAGVNRKWRVDLREKRQEPLEPDDFLVRGDRRMARTRRLSQRR